MAIAIPEAFGDRALLFAGSYVAIQVGRHTFLTFVAAGAGTVERERAGADPGLVRRGGRVLDRAAGSPTAARAPRCGSSRSRSTTRRRSSSTGCRAGRGSRRRVGRRDAHFAERFQLFMIIALGESIVVTGATTSELDLDAARMAALRARVPRHGGALVALLQLRRGDRRSGGWSSRRTARRSRATATRTSTS